MAQRAHVVADIQQVGGGLQQFAAARRQSVQRLQRAEQQMRQISATLRACSSDTP